MSINEQLFCNIDLNLTITFLVLFREGSVSRTAACMNVGQPAVSGSLSRLRSYFDDPLFIRTKSGVRPTHKAILIEQKLSPALHCIEAVLTGNV
ncbi:LysR family transcriptional regulator [Pseudomonas sp. NPDC096950]|uniref:LysR family transcriptional regulator n=1 Tax=Pseudomonas sp. NPDC096950 TaxID=3364485 RepID=UPI003839FEA5